MSNWTVDSLLKERNQLMAEKKDDKTASTESDKKEEPAAPAAQPKPDAKN